MASGRLLIWGAMLCPSITVKGFPDRFELVRIKRGVGDKLVSFHVSGPSPPVKLKLAGMPIWRPLDSCFSLEALS